MTLVILIIIAVAMLIIGLNSYALLNLVRIGEKIKGIGRYVTERRGVSLSVSFIKSLLAQLAKRLLADSTKETQIRVR